MSACDLLVLLGPTASGKTALAVDLAKKLNAEIVSADSRQVFRGMNIGTGKDLHLFGSVPYHLIDILEAGEQYNLARFQEDFSRVYRDIVGRGKLAILCGGTGLYLQAVLHNFDRTKYPADESFRKEMEELSYEELLQHFHFLFEEKGKNFAGPPPNVETRKRLIRAIEMLRFSGIGLPLPGGFDKPFQAPVVIGLSIAAPERRERITQRLLQRLDAGLLDEVKALLEQGVPAERFIFYGLEYKYAVLYLQGELDERQFFERLNTEIHRYAKRQMTFFRKMEKDGIVIHWLDALHASEDLVRQALRLLD